MGLNRVQIATGTTCIVVVLMVGMILFSCAFSVVLPNQAGIDFNTVTNKIDESQIYFEGRHWLGLGHKFITYPTTWQIMDFSNDEEEGDDPLDSGTSDGQTVTLEVTVFYSVPATNILKLYKLLGTSYKGVLLSAVKSELKNTASQFKTLEFFDNRAGISAAMEKNVGRVLAERHAAVERVLLREITFPSGIETQLVNKVIAGQQVIKNTHMLEVRKTQADITVIAATANRTINELLSAATAKGDLIVETANANATSIVVNAQADAWVDYRFVLGNITNDQLIRLQWARQLLRGSSSTRLLVGFDDLKGSTITP